MAWKSLFQRTLGQVFVLHMLELLLKIYKGKLVTKHYSDAVVLGNKLRSEFCCRDTGNLVKELRKLTGRLPVTERSVNGRLTVSYRSLNAHGHLADS